MFFDPEITNILRNALPWAGPFFRVITELGSELFYVVLILIGYWAYNKRESILAAYVLLVSVVTNYWLKLAIANPRPDPSYWYEGVEATNYSTPSGHAQNSTMLFGWLSVRVRRAWFGVLSVALILLIGISRVYLGVHYLGDVLIGWGIGLVLLMILVRLQEPLMTLFQRYRSEYLYLAMLIIGLALTVVSTLLPTPPGDNFGSLGGLIMGIAVAFPLEARYVNFDTAPPHGQRWRLILRVVLGLILVLGVMVGLSGVLPSSDTWFRALRYFLVVIVGAFLWPLVFERAGI